MQIILYLYSTQIDEIELEIYSKQVFLCLRRPKDAVTEPTQNTPSILTHKNYSISLRGITVHKYCEDF